METIHPMIVHFPIALLLTATLISFLAVLFKNKREELKTVLYWIMILGALSVLAALASGLYEDARGVVHDDAIHKIMEVHKLLGFIITAAFVSLTLWFVFRKSKIKYRELLIITLFLVATSSVLVYSAYLGGKMVYEEGTGVKPMEKYIMEMPGGSMYNRGEMMKKGSMRMEMDSSNIHADSTNKQQPTHNAEGHSH